MIDIKFLRENPDIVKENIKKKFQDHKLILVDEVIDLDKKNREAMMHGDELRNERKTLSNQIGSLMKEGKKEEAESIKAKVQEINNELIENEKKEEKYAEEIRKQQSSAPSDEKNIIQVNTKEVDENESVEFDSIGANCNNEKYRSSITSWYDCSNWK